MHICTTLTAIVVDTKLKSSKMNVKIADLMVDNVITAQPHQTVGHIKKVLHTNQIGAIPVVNSENEPVGIVTYNDLSKDLKSGTPISNLLQDHVFQVPAYNDISVAAKIMRKHKIHHVLVTHEGQLKGIISSFDLLKLIDGHRFTMKNPPQTKRRK